MKNVREISLTLYLFTKTNTNAKLLPPQEQQRKFRDVGAISLNLDLFTNTEVRANLTIMSAYKMHLIIPPIPFRMRRLNAL